MGEDERRRFRRTRKRVRLEFCKRKLYFLKGPRNSGEAVDISASGMRINTRLALVNGERVALLVRRASGEPEVTFSGIVVWVKPVTEAGHQFTQVGVHFSRLGVRQRVLLVRLATGV